MEKIKITKEQEEALKNFKRYGNNFESFVGRTSEYRSECKPLNDFTPEQFAILLHGWYEVEQPFKVGDWVINENGSGDYYKISEEFVSSMKFLTIDTVLCEPENFKKVEESWKIMLLELGREKPELKKGDMYTRVDKFSFSIKADTEEIPDSFLEGRIKYFYPVESRIEVKQ